jgi:dihydropteroate synthase
VVINVDDKTTTLMGVVNLTPDSFSDGGRLLSAEAAAAQARALVAAGAAIVDVGAESTRPGATPLGAAAEIERLLPSLSRIRGAVDVQISVDTYKAEVADRALAAGARIVNDISGGLFDADLLTVVARRRAGIVLGHVRGTPATIHEAPSYTDVVAEVRAELAARLDAARMAGIAVDDILVDPGLGFAKNAEHNLTLLAGLRDIVSLGRPVVIGASRKGFLGKITGRPVEDRERAAAAIHTAAILAGARVLRVHDVAFHADVARVADALRGAAC